MMSNQKVEVCYNAQMTVDSKHKLIVDFEMINSPADQGQLSNMAIRAKEILGVDEIEVLADKGYWDSVDIKNCIDNGITPTIPKPTRTGHKGNFFSKAHFTFDPLKNCYVCPANHELNFKSTVNERDRTIHNYQANDCSNCHLKSMCTKAESRLVTRWEHEHLLEEIQARVAANRAKVRLRQTLSEHPFGTLKRGFDQGYLLLKRFQKVRGEFSLSALSYNIKRAVNIVGVQGLIEALGSGIA